MKQNTTLKLPPQAIDIEEAVLGILILYSNNYIEVAHMLSPDVFYKETNGMIYKAMSDLFAQSKPIDMLSVSDMLRKNGDLDKIGGSFYLMELTDMVTNSSSLEYYCNVLIEAYRKRLGIEKATNLVSELYSDSADMVDNLALANEVVLSLTNEITNVGGLSMSDSLIELLREQENELNGDFSGCQSKYAELDKIIIGFKNQQVIVVAGRPGMGKTTFAINVAYRLARYEQTPVGFFSLEMSATELTKKFAAIETQICNSRIKNLDEYVLQDYFKKAQKLGDLPIYIDDKPGASIDDIRARAITMKRKYGIKFMVIDYLQLISANRNKSGNREQEISEISRKIKLLAKELDIPIMELAQLSRAVESTDHKIPQQYHLRESGSIEQDADIILMLWRPEYYDMPDFEFPEPGQVVDSKGKSVVFVRKNRNGETGRCLLRNNLALSSFYDHVDNYQILNDTF